MSKQAETQKAPNVKSYWLQARRNKIIVSDIQDEVRMVGMFHMPSSHAEKDPDIRSRWARVKSVGVNITDIKAGAWVLVENSDIATGTKLKDPDGNNITVWNVEYPKGVLAIPKDNMYADKCPTNSKITALKGKVIVSDIQKGERLIGKIILPNDDNKTSGIRSRWAQVFAIGEDITEVKVGEWVLMKHGNWTRGAELRDEKGEQYTLWGVNWPKGVIAASDKSHDSFADESIYHTEKKSLL